MGKRNLQFDEKINLNENEDLIKKQNLKKRTFRESNVLNIANYDG